MRPLSVLLLAGLLAGCGGVEPSGPASDAGVNDGTGGSVDLPASPSPDGPLGPGPLPLVDGGRDAGAPDEDLGGIGTPLPDDDGGGLPDPDALLGPPDGGPEPEPDAGEPTTPPEPCPTYRLRHLQASMQRTDPVGERRASIDAAFDAGAHTISWTEIENIEAVRRIDARAGWQTFWPSGSPEVLARNAVPISWRTDTFELIRGRAWKASDGLAGVSPSRWVVRVWLRHKASGQVQSRVSHHAISGVDNNREPVEFRQEAHAQDIAKFREVMLLDTVPVVGSGDFNTVRLRTLLGSAFRYDVPASGGSHGSRLIDWIVRRPHADLTFVSARFMTLGTSDHRGVRAGYDYRPACQP